jgi:hypothetical protein
MCKLLVLLYIFPIRETIFQITKRRIVRYNYYVQRTYYLKLSATGVSKLLQYSVASPPFFSIVLRRALVTSFTSRAWSCAAAMASSAKPLLHETLACRTLRPILSKASKIVTSLSVPFSQFTLTRIPCPTFFTSTFC